MKYRRFGKTGFQMPVLSCGGMRYQQSWKDSDPVSAESQRNLEATIRRSVEVGINHIETARGYGTSEYQLGKILPQLARDEILVQTKVRPFYDVQRFIDTFEQSMSLLQLDHVDIFSFHGINNDDELEATLKCLDTAEQWKREGRIRDIGFSTHGDCATIVKAIETGAFEHVNIHWYYIFQENWPAIEAAQARDMGVFIISPNDKGGKLYEPSARMAALCAPLHPMVFNGLFCLLRPEVHTLSCGAARPEDFDIHLEMVDLLPRAAEWVPPIVARLDTAFEEALGSAWAATWRDGLPAWHAAPGEVNLPVILHLHNLVKAFDLLDYGRMRYNMLGNGGSWFPGQPYDAATPEALAQAVAASPHAAAIPAKLAEAHKLLSGVKRKRLQQSA